MSNNDSHQHVVKTTSQWNDRAVEYWVVPRGCLCIELTPEGKTKLKVGEGNKFYHQLPYVCEGSDLSNYYTKEEIDNIIDNINRMAIMSTDEYDSKNDLPLDGNKLGDVRFVKSNSPSISTEPDIYLWNGTKWIFVGTDISSIDLDDFVKKEEFEVVKDKVDIMYPKMHEHTNKDVLDQTTAPYTIPEKEKLAGLHNYDDTEIRELIHETGHTHPNKSLLDTITSSSLWNEADRIKFNDLHNYDDTEVVVRIETLEEKSHTHSNKNILDQTTAPFQVADKEKLDSLQNYDVFRGTDGIYPGGKGLVPGPTIADSGKFLSSSGEWLPVTVVDFVGATPTEDGEHGLVPAPMTGQQSYYLRGDGTWAKVKSGDKYRAGDGIYILAGEAISDAYPFKIYSRSAYLTQYIIYGTDAGVGEWDAGQNKFVINLSITADGETPMVQQILLNNKLYAGDYIDFERQIIVTSKQDMKDYVTLYNHPSYGTSGTYQWRDGSIGGNYYYNPGVTNNIAVTPGDRYWIKAFPNEYIYADNSYHCIFNANDQVTRYFAAKGAGPMIIEIQPGETYARFVGKPSWNMVQPGFLYKLEQSQEPTVLPRISLFPGKINTVNVTNTNKPSQIYVKAYSDEPEDPDDPTSFFTGIIYNEGVLDITQEDPNALNELTVHFRDDSKVLTIPSDSYTPGDGIDITNNEISAKLGSGLQFDANGAIETTGEGGTEYAAGQGIEIETDTVATYEDLHFDYYAFKDKIQGVLNGSISFDIPNHALTISATNNYCYVFPYSDSDGQLYKIPVEPNEDYLLTWEVNDTTIAGKVDVFENGDVTVGHYNPAGRESAASQQFLFTTSSTAETIHIRPYVYDGGTSLTFSNFQLYHVIYDTSGKIINAKLGDGLHFDSNDAIEVDSMIGATSQAAGTGGTVPAPSAGDNVKFLRGDGSWAEIETSTKYAEGDAIEFSHPGMTDLGFDFDTFVSKFTQPNNGTVSVNSTNKSFILTATGFDCYTNPWAGGALYTIPVIGGRKYRLTWNSNASNVDGTVYAFENANTSHMHGVNQADQNYLEFTADTSSNVNFRFGVTNSGNSITYSNIKFYEVDNADPDTNIINVKYGNGLSLDNNNALQVDGMVGATSQTAGQGGTVPAPSAGDENKFLRGDGTWETVSSGTQYQAGQGIEIEPVPELIDQHFNYTAYINTVQGVEYGSIVKNNNDSFTITATANGAYTYPYNSGHGALYTMPVEPNTKYRLTMDLSDWTVDSYVDVFRNQTTLGWRADMPGDPYLEFTTESNTREIAFRFGVTYSGHTQTFSNIKLYQISESTTTDSISAKLGSGLQFDANNAIEAIPYTLPTASASTLGGVKVGSGLSIDSSTGVLSATGSTYSFREGTTIGAFEVQENDGAWQQIAVHSVGTSLSKGNGLTSTEPPDKIYLMSASNTPLSNITLGLLDPIVDSQQQVTGWKIKETYLPSYVDDVIEGYYYNNQFYEDDQHTTVITPESGKIYIDIPNNESYRWGGTTYVMISNPVDVFHGADGTNPGTVGLVPAPLATDNTKFLKGDGTWAVGYTHPTYTPHTLGIYKIAVDSTGHVNTAQNVESTDIENLLGHIVIYCSDDVSDGIQLGTPVDAPVAANKTLSSVKENDLTILEV